MFYLRQDLVKGSSDASKDDGGKNQTGEMREGSYVARVQDGYESDGSPKYRYFKTAQEHREYLEHKNRPGSKKDKKDDKLKDKLDKEHETSRKRSQKTHGTTSLFVKDNASRSAKKQSKEKVSKSFDLFVWRLD